MALSARVSFRGIHREIRAVARRLRTARRRAEAGNHAHLDALMRKLAELDTRTTALCTRTFGVWPPPEKRGPKPPAKPAPAKPKKGGRKPSRRKKGR